MTTLELPDDAAKERRIIRGRVLAAKKARRNKYNAVKTIIGEHRFDSKREAQAWTFLKARERAGEIRDLRRQVKFELLAWVPPALNECVCRYVADFVYFDVKRGREVVADAKGVKTALFRLKAKMLLANYGIEVELM